jgi:RNA polymerase sigma-70 factor (ECF subfamily)
LIISSSPRFPTTHWSWVNAAAEPSANDSAHALRDLCAAYWYPIYSLIRGLGYATHEAEDITQEYFVHLLNGATISAADQHKGRFRGFLRADCRFFLAHYRERQHALKRGGRVNLISLDTREAEGRYQAEAQSTADPLRLFDRAWAHDLMAQALARLEREENEAGRGAVFQRLRSALTEAPHALPITALASELGKSVDAVQAAVQRLRKRYRVALRDEVAITLHEPSEAEIDEEIRDLFQSFES